MPDPIPRRLSDHERDSAVAALRAHFEAGRLDHGEFEQRMQAALVARTASDIVPLFTDLPEPHPTFLATAQPTWNTYPPAGRPAEPGAPSYGAPAPPYGVPSGALVPRTPTSPPVPAQFDRTLDTVQALIWPVAIVLLLFGNTGFWPIIMAIIVSTAIGAYRGNRKRRQPPPY